MSETLTIKKITAKLIGCNKIGTGFRIIGRVVSISTGKTQFGDFARFRGAFEAQTFTYDKDGVVTEGNTYKAGVAILPPLVEAEVLTSLNALQDKMAGASMELAYDIKLIKAENPMGREWAAQSLIATRAEADPLAGLRKALAPPAPAAQLTSPNSHSDDDAGYSHSDGDDPETKAPAKPKRKKK